MYYGILAHRQMSYKYMNKRRHSCRATCFLWNFNSGSAVNTTYVADTGRPATAANGRDTPAVRASSLSDVVLHRFDEPGA